MIPKSYYNNISSKNILHNYKPKDMSTDYVDNITSESLENIIINSNLNNSNAIK